MPRLALIQMACNAGREENIAHAERRIAEAAAQGANIVCLPEIFHELFFVIYRDTSYCNLAEAVPGPITDRMQVLARKLGIVLVVPLYEKAARGIYYNSAVVFDADGKLLGTYRKTHIPLNPTFHEKLYFKPGNLGYPVFRTRFGNIGIAICHDRHYPEPARCLALGGADLILVPTATHNSNLSRKVWEKELCAMAIFNELFVGAVNRVGLEGDDFDYYGCSLIANPEGDIVAQAGEEESILCANLDFDEIDRRRQGWHFFRDRRPETYQALVQPYP